MSSVAKFAALVAAVAILVVLITPAPDELPSTASRHTLYTITLSANIPVVLKIVLPRPQEAASVLRFLSGTDLLSLTCTRLC